MHMDGTWSTTVFHTQYSGYNIETCIMKQKKSMLSTCDK